MKWIDANCDPEQASLNSGDIAAEAHHASNAAMLFQNER